MSIVASCASEHTFLCLVFDAVDVDGAKVEQIFGTQQDSYQIEPNISFPQCTTYIENVEMN